jgi:MFS family permease
MRRPGPMTELAIEPRALGPRPRRGGPPIPPNVWAVALTSLFSDWSYEMLLPILPFFLALDLGASPFVIGVVEGLAVFAQSVAQYFSGRGLARRGDRRKVGAAGYTTTTAAHALISLVTAWPYAAVLRVTAWTARGERQPIKKAILADASEAPTLGRSFGWEQMFDSIGAVCGTASAAFVIVLDGVAGFRTIFAISIVPGLVAVVLFTRLVRDRPVPATSAPGLSSSDSPPFPWAFRWFLVATALFGVAFFNILLGLLRIGTGLLGTGGTGAEGAILVALIAYLVYNLTYAGLSFPSGILVDRFPRIGLVALSYALFAVVDLLFIATPSVPIALVAFFLAGAQIALSDVAQSAWITRAVAPDQVGRAFGWLGAIQGTSSLVASVLVGWLWTTYTPGLAFEVSAILAIASVALLLPIAVLRLRERRSENGPGAVG